jgi:hypothetical protein
VKEEAGLPDGEVAHGSLIKIGVAVHGALRAQGLATSQARLAVEASIVLVTPANRLALLELLDVLSNFLLMAPC